MGQDSRRILWGQVSSGGIGGLAVFSKNSGASTYVNEFSARRAGFLKEMGFENISQEDAAQLDNVLPLDIKPTVIVMNPPFSATAGRTSINQTMNGAKHIEQALNRLEPGGRLVAIVGQGMAMDAAHFNKWWSKIKGEYNVLANVGVSGKEYAKYGTTFDNQILVIDKTGATVDNVVTGKVDSFSELIPVLEGIKGITNEKTTKITASNTKDSELEQNMADKQGSKKGPAESGSAIRGGEDVLPPVDVVGPGEQRSDAKRDDTGNGIASDEKVPRKGDGDIASKRDGKSTKKPKGTGSDSDTTTGRMDSGRSTGSPKGELKEPVKDQNREEITDSVYDKYYPNATMAGAKTHVTPLVESAAMADTKPPAGKYLPDIPQKTIDNGDLTDAQLESIIYAGRAHEQHPAVLQRQCQ